MKFPTIAAALLMTASLATSCGGVSDGSQERANTVKNMETPKHPNVVAGEEFLAKKAQEEGVIKTESGLMYKVIRQGDGPKPTVNDQVSTHYRGTLVDGREFDSSYGRGEPATFPVSGVIPGWIEVLQLMPVGSKYEVYIPWNLAYGKQARSQLITPYSTLVFEMELLDIL